MSANSQALSNAAVPRICFVSGKGGVGKTLLAVNLARFLSRSAKKVLLIDLDFYNRGSTALLFPHLAKNTPTSYSMLRLAGTSQEPLVSGRDIVYQNALRAILKEAPLPNHDSLYLLPSTVAGEIVEWIEFRYSTAQLRELVTQIIKAAREECEAECVVIDCRAGPDPLSIAVAGLCTFTVIVSEADPVTWAGTLNLHRYILNEYKQPENLWFLLNKVPRKYRLFDLSSFYAERMKEGILALFSNMLILSAIPFEYEVFESFGEKRFIVDEMPQSVFAGHIARVAYQLLGAKYDHLISVDIELFKKQAPEALSAKSLGRYLRNRRRLFLVGSLFYVLTGLVWLYIRYGAIEDPLDLVPVAVILMGLLLGIAALLSGEFS